MNADATGRSVVIEAPPNALRGALGPGYDLTVGVERTGGRPGVGVVWVAHRIRPFTKWLISLDDAVPHGSLAAVDPLA